MGFQIRACQPLDAQAFRVLRLETLKANPECFCTSLEEARSQGVGQFEQLIDACCRSDDRQLLGAFDDGGQLVGALALERLRGQLRLHRGRLWGLAVMPDARRQGVARALCAQAITTARRLEGVEKLSLELTGEAVAALRLYRSLGFRIEGVEPLALKLNGRYLDEIRMALCL